MRLVCLILNTFNLNVTPPQVDQRVFKDLMSEKLPRLHAHFEQHKVDFSLITFNWFLVVFVDSVVSEILLKIWDAFLYEGPKVRRSESTGGNRVTAPLVGTLWWIELRAAHHGKLSQ